MGIIIAGETHADVALIGESFPTMLAVSLLSATSSTAAIRARTSFDLGSTWSSPTLLGSNIALPKTAPAIAGPDPKGRIFVFYITPTGSVAMKWTDDLGKTWYG